MTDATQKAGAFRIFMDDGTAMDIDITGSWNAFVNDYFKNGCIVTENTLIERASVNRIMRLYPQGSPPPSHDNVISFPDPKGNA